MKCFQKGVIIFLGALLIRSIAPAPALAEDATDASRVIIKVDSDGLRAEIIVTARALSPEGLGVDSPQARLLTKNTAAALAYGSLVKVVETIAADYFPKERYFSKDGFIKGVKLTEVRYLGDGSAEADAELDIALNGPLANKFEKAMQVAGYRVVEYDRPDTEMINEVSKP